MMIMFSHRYRGNACVVKEDSDVRPVQGGKQMGAS